MSPPPQPPPRGIERTYKTARTARRLQYAAITINSKKQVPMSSQHTINIQALITARKVASQITGIVAKTMELWNAAAGRAGGPVLN